MGHVVSVVMGEPPRGSLTSMGTPGRLRDPRDIERVSPQEEALRRGGRGDGPGLQPFLLLLRALVAHSASSISAAGCWMFQLRRVGSISLTRD